MKNQTIKLFFYLLTTALYVTCVIKDLYFTNTINLTGYKTFGGRFKFLTKLNVYAQLIYFILCSLHIFIQIFSEKLENFNRSFGNTCNFLYTSLIWPIGSFVAITFWAIYLVNRDLIFPKVLDDIIPPWQNHLMHTLPLISSLLDNYLTRHYYSSSFLKGFVPTFIYGFLYKIWILIIYIYGGFWVYPVLAVLTPPFRIIFFIGLFMFLAILYKLGDLINSILWPNKHERLELKRRSRKVQ